MQHHQASGGKSAENAEGASLGALSAPRFAAQRLLQEDSAYSAWCAWLDRCVAGAVNDRPALAADTAGNYKRVAARFVEFSAGAGAVAGASWLEYLNADPSRCLGGFLETLPAPVMRSAARRIVLGVFLERLEAEGLLRFRVSDLREALASAAGAAADSPPRPAADKASPRPRRAGAAVSAEWCALCDGLVTQLVQSGLYTFGQAAELRHDALRVDLQGVEFAATGRRAGARLSRELMEYLRRKRLVFRDSEPGALLFVTENAAPLLSACRPAGRSDALPQAFVLGERLITLMLRDEGAALENLRGMTLAELRAAPLSDAAERLRRDYLQLLRVSSLAYGRAADAQTLRAFPMLA